MGVIGISKTILIVLFIVIALAFGSVVYNYLKPPVTKTEYIKVPEIKEVIKIKRIKVPVKEIVTLEKTEAVEKLKLPDWIAKDQNKQVIATGEISPYEGKTDIVTILDTISGDAEMVAKQKPMSLFGFEDKKEIGARYGISTKRGQEIDIYGRWSFFRIGKTHLAVYGEVSSGMDKPDLEAKAMLDGSYRW